MTDAFTPDAARALGGPDWLVERRRRARPSGSPTIAWPTAGRGDLALQPDRRARPRPVPAVRRPSELGAARRRAGARRRPVGGRGRRARRAWSSCATAGSCTTSSIPRSRPRACACAASRRATTTTCASVLGACSDASPDAFTRAARRVPRRRRVRHVPAGVVVEDPIVVLHWSEGDGRALVPAHARRRSARTREVTVLDRFGSPRDRPPRRRGRRAHRRRQRARALPLGAGARPAHVAARAAARARRPRRDRCARRRSRSAATTPGCAASRCSTGEGARERPARGLLRRRHADARLPHAPGPRRAAARAATCCSRARSRTTPARCTRASSASAHDAQKVERVPDEPQPRAHRGRRARSRSRTSRSRPTTCSARTRRPSARSTTTSSTTSRAAACRPRRPSGSSCSASSTTCSSGCRCASLVAPLRRAVVEKIEHRAGRGADGLSVRRCARRRRRAGHGAALRRRRPPPRASCASATTSTRSATTCSHADYSLSEGDVWEDEREIECPKHGSTFSLDDRRAADAARHAAGARLRRCGSTATT